MQDFLINLIAKILYLLTHDGKNDNASKKRGRAVCHSHKNGVSCAVIIRGIVGGISDQTSESETE